ncbi:hypothetical protein C1N83_19960 [Priestia aryabhattai]|uniref:Uncharacterized protein n=1 Tax=Priestia megaterium (strain WSH-002) TaxID=1006007 RepID=A0A8D3X2C7_PRIMW|nr:MULTISPECIES: hypothetical protein [Priestia]AEN90447.1 hypothetical protein BMWSH_3565 [Priestia megaterium WSH-002]KML31813.1 hypothetical protein VL11_01155 [Priestia aryabhattai]KMN94990.1 hypothetical protein ABV89_23720 [Priestia aryabhattai]MDE8674822.1 hypothetical protein [Priestia aryabhattai]MED4392262.1 hypothetical protein [Priestia aryabhattai]
MSERQNAFTIKTNQLSDEVYDILAKYAKSRKLGDYISSLIVRDLHSSSSNQVEAGHRTEELLEHINSELRELKKLAQSNGFVSKQEETEEKPSESHQTFKEGKVADLEQLSGSLDDDDLEEYNDF